MSKGVLERKFQKSLKDKIRDLFKGCLIIKLDADELQGIPDLLILWKDKWATLECKRNRNSTHQPNQDYYVNLMNKMSFSSFIYPENEEEVLYELQQAFQS